MLHGINVIIEFSILEFQESKHKENVSHTQH